MASKKHRHFPEAFKRQAVERVGTRWMEICRLAEKLDVYEMVLRHYGTARGAPSRRCRARPQRISPRRTPA